MIPAVLQAQAAALAAKEVIGMDRAPTVLNYGTYAAIELDAEQEDQIARFIIRQLDREPGQVRINLAGVALKVLARKYWPHLAGLVGAGALVGALAARALKRGRK